MESVCLFNATHLPRTSSTQKYCGSRSWYSVVLSACVTPSTLSTIGQAKSYVGYTLQITQTNTFYIYIDTFESNVSLCLHLYFHNYYLNLSPVCTCGSGLHRYIVGLVSSRCPTRSRSSHEERISDRTRCLSSSLPTSQDFSPPLKG